jgi:hypothetical protein
LVTLETGELMFRSGQVEDKNEESEDLWRKGTKAVGVEEVCSFINHWDLLCIMFKLFLCADSMVNKSQEYMTPLNLHSSMNLYCDGITCLFVCLFCTQEDDSKDLSEAWIETLWIRPQFIVNCLGFDVR